ncbi:hypothetical protein GALL_345190 [mine drainage metagenome]|uniref:DUF2207 domain-containing protein n=1 Tax=mine drainage metagenome TaxID=410659 RepID=A0A1J5R683_9ZZZZ
MSGVAVRSMPGRRRAAVVVVIVGLLVAWGGFASSAVAAVRASDTGGRHVTRYALTYTLTSGGNAHVAIDLDFDFGGDPGHGPTITIPVQQAISGDSSHVRSYPVSDITASSPTGAPAGVNTATGNGWLTVNIGDPSQGSISGAQRYHIEYTIGSVVNSFSDHAEFYWNVVSPDAGSIPISGVSVSVVGPVAADGATCFSGPAGSTTPCDAGAVGADGTATFTQQTLTAGNGLTVAVHYPASAFSGAKALIIATPSPLDPVTPTAVTGALALLIAGVGSVLVVRRVRRNGRDRQYLGLTPGLAPAPGQELQLGYRDKRTPVAVQFTPPPTVSPGEVGTLLDEVADPKDVTATIIDLAVHGYLRIDEIPPAKAGRKPTDWTLSQLREAGPELKSFESALLGFIFTGRQQVALSDLKTTFASSMSKVQTLLYEDVTDNRWFSANPASVRSRWQVGGAILAFFGLFGAFAFANVFDVKGISLVPGALVVVGVVMFVVAKAAPARTPAGTAVLAQAVGFQRYLTTAEANQIRFEEGEDLFSRYLPYAIVFGVAERWARVFGELAAQGNAVAEPAWYGGAGFHTGMFWVSYAAFGSNLDTFTNLATESIAAPTPGSSGGSGFGGGGFSGGGGGGGGVGGW